ncbi:MAG: hypothetical protein CVV27_17005, partial [Candidatus Melainabacteria bacterium HGW-Melainabacteria-1]
APPIVINAYPAHIGTFEFGIFVDTYLSSKIALRALQLAAQQERTALLLGQPLFVAEILYRAIESQCPLPRSIVVAAGGYFMPASLQRALTDALRSRNINLLFVHCYGIAEVDAACLVGLDRTDAGDILFFERGPDIIVTLEDGRLLLTRKNLMGADIVSKVSTGDQSIAYQDAYLIQPASNRLAKAVRESLESWDMATWERRTGYMYFGRRPYYQLREGCSPQSEEELTHFSFAEKFGFSWLNKPDWGKQVHDEPSLNS